MSDSIFNSGLPGMTRVLLDRLDDEIPPAIVTDSHDIDAFELGKQAGKRELVDDMLAAYRRQQQEIES